MDGLIAYALSKKYTDEVGRSILDVGFKTQVEQDRSILQTTGQEKILYFIPKTTAKPSDGYDEYVYSNNAWEQVGVTDIDLSSIDYNSLSNIPVLFIENNQVPLRGKFALNGFTDNYNQTNDTHILSINFLYGTYIAFDSIPYDRLANYWQYIHVHGVDKSFPLSDLYNNYTNDIIWTYDGLNDTPSVVDEVVAVMQFKDVAYRTIQILIGKKFETESSPFHYECYIREKVGIQDFSDWTVLGTGYTLTQQDKTDIANIVLQELPTTQGVLYGNASN